jgi:hypothetical protein
MAKRPPPGRCVHCLRHFDELTWDHVFPEAWYPETTPANLEKWKIPSCLECNLIHSKSEGDLLIRFGLCIDPDDPKNAGIVEKTLRAVSAQEGKNEKDAYRREALRQKILKEVFEGDEIPYQAVYPGFGPQPGIHNEVRVAVPVSATKIRRLVEKIVRGITYIEDEKFVEKPFAIHQYVLSDESASPLKVLLDRFGTVYERGPGITVIRAVTPEDQMTAMYLIEIWGRLKGYAVLSKDED